MSKRKLGACITFFPQPTTLVVSRDTQGNVNLMTASWAGVVSKTPPTLAISLHRDRQTLANIRETGSFTINVVPVALMQKADLCGVRSGRQLDKAAVTGLTLKPSDNLETPIIDESPLNFECRLTGELEIGDYRLLMGEILEVHAVEEAFAVPGQIQAKIFDPLVYLGGIREYWSLGERAGVAYRDGLALLPDEKGEGEK